MPHHNLNLPLYLLIRQWRQLLELCTSYPSLAMLLLSTCCTRAFNIYIAHSLPYSTPQHSLPYSTPQHLLRVAYPTALAESGVVLFQIFQTTGKRHSDLIAEQKKAAESASPRCGSRRTSKHDYLSAHLSVTHLLTSSNCAARSLLCLLSEAAACRYDACLLWCDAPKDILVDRLDRRVEKMVTGARINELLL